MDLEQFIRAVLPASEGLYFTATERAINNHPFTPHACNGLDALLERLRKDIALNRNVYVATAVFGDKLNSKGNPSREAANAKFKQAFYLDMDCGEDKPYLTKLDALEAIKNFCKDREFPYPSIVVDSGTGVHIYWVLDGPVRATVWADTANAFKNFLRVSGVECDSKITADAARVMRVPTSFNYKPVDKLGADSPAACIARLASGGTLSYETFLSHLPSPQEISNVIAIDTGEKVDNSALESVSEAPRYAAEILKECPSLKQQVDTGGAEADYNLWFTTLQLLKYCEDGHKYYEAVSNKHKGYSEEVLRKKLSDMDTISYGPATCEAFANANRDNGCTGACDACPHWDSSQWDTTGNFRSPIAFGKLAPETDTSTLSMPWGWVKHKGNTCQIKRREDEVEYVMKFHGYFSEIRIFGNTDVPTMEVDYHTRGRDMRRVRVPVHLLNGRKTELSTYMINVNKVPFENWELGGLGELLMSWYKQAQAVAETIPAVNQFGWIKGKKRTGFGFGETIAWEDGTFEENAHCPVGSIAEDYEPRGERDHWIESVRRAFQAEHIETEILVAAAFAAPLVALSEESGCVVSAFSPESGTGKSLGLKLGQAVWGHPIKGMISLNDTANSVVNRIAVTNNLPAYWDEVRISDRDTRKQFIDLIYRTTLGKEKARLESSSEARVVRNWAAMIICTSNQSLYDIIMEGDRATNAAHLRVLEFSVSPLDRSKMADAHGFTGLRDNYGVIGLEYAQFLAQNRSAIQKQLNRLIADISKKWECSTDERFQVISVATLLLGALLAKNHLQVADFNIPKMKTFLKDTMRGSREMGGDQAIAVSEEHKLVAMLGEYIAEHTEQIMITSKLRCGRHKTAELKMGASPLRQPVLGRFGIEDCVLRLRRTELAKWVQKTRGNSTTTLQRIHDKLGAKTVQAAMYTGIMGDNHPLDPRNRCVEIPLNDHTASLFPEEGEREAGPSSDLES